MGWGDFKRKVGLNKLKTRKVVAKVAKVIPPAALVAPTKEGLQSAAGAMQVYSQVGKSIASGDFKGAAKNAIGAAKFAATALKNDRSAVARPVQIAAPVGAWEEGTGVMPTPVLESDRQAEMDGTTKMAMWGMAAVVVLALAAKGLKK